MVKTYTIVMIAFAVMMLTLPKHAFAASEAGASARLAVNQPQFTMNLVDINYAVKKSVIRDTLEAYSSPLIGFEDEFINACKTYGIDCYLLPAISGLESTFGKFILSGSFNPFGWGGGYIHFTNWGDAINTVARELKANYMNHGALTIEEVGHIYSESPTWAQRVRYFRNKMLESEKKQLNLSTNSVEL
ncbi:glucosaminidase domain-containing protein [Candidatus Roizmanbacteria bacterium]|nr:glucosaminidase domain-containing protein [Candidatus Roizmanbacteria bacterium]